MTRTLGVSKGLRFWPGLPLGEPSPAPSHWAACPSLCPPRAGRSRQAPTEPGSRLSATGCSRSGQSSGVGLRFCVLLGLPPPPGGQSPRVTLGSALGWTDVGNLPAGFSLCLSFPCNMGSPSELPSVTCSGPRPRLSTGPVLEEHIFKTHSDHDGHSVQALGAGPAAVTGAPQRGGEVGVPAAVMGAPSGVARQKALQV